MPDGYIQGVTYGHTRYVAQTPAALVATQRRNAPGQVVVPRNVVYEPSVRAQCRSLRVSPLCPQWPTPDDLVHPPSIDSKALPRTGSDDPALSLGMVLKRLHDNASRIFQAARMCARSCSPGVCSRS